MTYRGFNIRKTLVGGTAFPGDGPNDQWSKNQVYVASALGGDGFGFSGVQTTTLSDVNNPATAHVGGVILNNSSTQFFRFDVPKGPVDVRLAIGNGNNNTRLRYGPGNVSGTDFTDVLGVTSGSGLNVTDANGNVWPTPASWDTNNVPLRVNNIVGYLELDKAAAGFSKTQYVSYQLVQTNLADIIFADEGGMAGAPGLFESQVPGKRIALLTQTIGGSPATSITAYESDGVTPSLYLQVVFVNGQYWLAHTSTRMPNLSGTYNFKLIQADLTGEGVYLNAPYSQTLAWTVTAAPTKPWQDGTRASKLSTGAFLLKKKITDFVSQTYNGALQKGEWLGYTGGAFTSTTIVATNAQLITAIAAVVAAAASASNAIYEIQIDNTGASDWTTTNGFSGKVNIKPENGNILYIHPKPGATIPLIKGTWATQLIRGVHISGLTFCCDGSVSGAGQSISWFGNSVTDPLSIILVEQCNFGALFDPANAALYGPTNIPQAMLKGAIGSATNVSVCEQVIIRNCNLWGIDTSFTVFGAKLVHVSHIDIAVGVSDCLITGAGDVKFAGLFVTNQDQYEWYDDVNYRAVVNNTAISGAHADFNQQRPEPHNGAGGVYAPGTTYRCIENCNVAYNFTTSQERNVLINSDSNECTINHAMLNNAIAAQGLRGFDIGCGIGSISYAEFNSLGVAAVFSSVDGQSIFTSNPAGTRSQISVRTYKNISVGSGGQGDLNYSKLFSGSPAPATYMNGPFIQSATASLYWAAQNLADDPGAGVTSSQFKATMFNLLKSATGVDAGIMTPDGGGSDQPHKQMPILFGG